MSTSTIPPPPPAAPACNAQSTSAVPTGIGAERGSRRRRGGEEAPSGKRKRTTHRRRCLGGPADAPVQLRLGAWGVPRNVCGDTSRCARGGDGEDHCAGACEAGRVRQKRCQRQLGGGRTSAFHGSVPRRRRPRTPRRTSPATPLVPAAAAGSAMCTIVLELKKEKNGHDLDLGAWLRATRAGQVDVGNSPHPQHTHTQQRGSESERQPAHTFHGPASIRSGTSSEASDLACRTTARLSVQC